MTVHHRQTPAWRRLMILLLIPLCAQAIINPRLQPGHLFERYDVVMELKVTSVDVEKQTAKLQVLQVIKGTFAPKTVAVTASGDDIKMANKYDGVFYCVLKYNCVQSKLIVFFSFSLYI